MDLLDSQNLQTQDYKELFRSGSAASSMLVESPGSVLTATYTECMPQGVLLRAEFNEVRLVISLKEKTTRFESRGLK